MTVSRKSGGWWRALRYGHPLYGRGSRKDRAEALLFSPSDIWPGDAERGRGLLRGEYSFFGKIYRSERPLWQPDGASPAWLEELHGFSWLRDLRAVGGDRARSFARESIEDWIDSNPRWSDGLWDPHIIGRRLVHWLAMHDFCWSSAADRLYQRITASIAQQARHLSRALSESRPGADAVAAGQGLLFAGLCLPGRESWAEQGLRQLQREIDLQIAADGGHISRSPRRHMAVLIMLLDSRAILRQANRPVPELLDSGIARMGRALKTMMHGDGATALFNNSWESPAALARQILIQADVKGRAPQSLAESGFERLSQGRTVIIVDSGPAPPRGYDYHSHAGTLSFEMSAGRERLIVNCGAAAIEGAWQEALRRTGAHSTVGIAGVDSGEIVTGGGLKGGPVKVTVDRQQTEGAFLLTASHDGYAKRFGITHGRRLYLSREGRDLRGEDRLTGDSLQRLDLRFHLHPGVQISALKGGHDYLLRLPGGQGWRFRSALPEGLSLSLEDSVYFGDGMAARRTRQIVISGDTTPPETVIKWAIQREG